MEPLVELEPKVFQKALKEFKAQLDLETLELKDGKKIGHPVRVSIYKSKTLNKQLVKVPVYEEVKLGSKVLEYRVVKTLIFLRPYDEEISPKLTIINTHYN